MEKHISNLTGRVMGLCFIVLLSEAPWAFPDTLPGERKAPEALMAGIQLSCDPRDTGWVGTALWGQGRAGPLSQAVTIRCQLSQKNTENEKVGERNLPMIAEEMELETPEFPFYLTILSLLYSAQL